MSYMNKKRKKKKGMLKQCKYQYSPGHLIVYHKHTNMDFLPVVEEYEGFCVMYTGLSC